MIVSFNSLSKSFTVLMAYFLLLLYTCITKLCVRYEHLFYFLPDVEYPIEGCQILIPGNYHMVTPITLPSSDFTTHASS